MKHSIFSSKYSYKLASRFACVFISAVLMCNSFLMTSATNGSPLQANIPTSSESSGSSSNNDGTAGENGKSEKDAVTGGTESSVSNSENIGSSESGSSQEGGSGGEGSQEGGSGGDGSQEGGSGGDGSQEGGSGGEGSQEGGSGGDGSQEGGSGGDGSQEGGSGGDGSQEGGSGGEGSQEGGSDGEGSQEGGSGGDGSQEGGSDGEGSQEGGSDGEGSQEGGSGGDGSQEGGSDGEGSQEGGSGGDGSQEGGSAGEGSQEGGSDSEGSQESGSDSEGSQEGGSGSEGSQEGGSGSEGSQTELPNEEESEPEGEQEPTDSLPVMGLFTKESDLIQLFEEALSDFKISANPNPVSSGDTVKLSFQMGIAASFDENDFRMAAEELLVRVDLPLGTDWSYNSNTAEIVSGSEYAPDEEPDADDQFDYVWIIVKDAPESGETIWVDFTISVTTNNVTPHGQILEIPAQAYYRPGGSGIPEPGPSLASTVEIETTVSYFEWKHGDLTVTDGIASSSDLLTTKLEDTGALPDLTYDFSLTEGDKDTGSVYTRDVTLEQAYTIETFADSGIPKILLSADNIKPMVGKQLRNWDEAITLGNTIITPVILPGDTVAVDGVDYLTSFTVKAVFVNSTLPPSAHLSNPEAGVVISGAVLHDSITSLEPGQVDEASGEELYELYGHIYLESTVTEGTPGYRVQNGSEVIDPDSENEQDSKTKRFDSVREVAYQAISTATQENLEESKSKGLRKQRFAKNTRLYDGNSADKTVWQGETVTHALHTFGNYQRGEMESLTLTDSFNPAQLRAVTLYPGSYLIGETAWDDSSNAFTVTIVFEDGTGKNYTITNYARDYYDDTIDLGLLQANEGKRITEIRFLYEDIPAGFRPDEKNPPHIDFEIQHDPAIDLEETDPDRLVGQNGKYAYPNHATLAYVYQDEIIDGASADWTEYYIPGISHQIGRSKEAFNETANTEGNPTRDLRQGDILTFTLTVTNNYTETVDYVDIYDYYSKYLTPHPASGDSIANVKLQKVLTATGGASSKTAGDLLVCLDNMQGTGGASAWGGYHKEQASNRDLDSGYADESLCIRLKVADGLAPGESVVLTYQMRVGQIEEATGLVANKFWAWGYHDHTTGEPCGCPWEIDNGYWGWNGNDADPTPYIDVTLERNSVDTSIPLTKLTTGDKVRYKTTVSRIDGVETPIAIGSIYSKVANTANTVHLTDLPTSSSNVEDIALELLLTKSGAASVPIAYTISPLFDNDKLQFRVDFDSAIQLEKGDVITLSYVGTIGEVTGNNGISVVNTTHVGISLPLLQEGTTHPAYLVKSGTKLNDAQFKAASDHVTSSSQSIVQATQSVNVRRKGLNPTVGINKTAANGTLSLHSTSLSRTYTVNVFNYGYETVSFDRMVDLLPEYETLVEGSVKVTVPNYPSTTRTTHTLPQDFYYVDEDNGMLVIDQFYNYAQEPQDSFTVPVNTTTSGTTATYAYSFTYSTQISPENALAWQALMLDGEAMASTQKTTNYAAVYLKDQPAERTGVTVSLGSIVEDQDDWDNRSHTTYRIQNSVSLTNNTPLITPIVSITPRSVVYSGSKKTYTYSAYTATNAGNEVGWQVTYGNPLTSNRKPIAAGAYLLVALPAGMELKGFGTAGNMPTENAGAAELNGKVSLISREIDENGQQTLVFQLTSPINAGTANAKSFQFVTTTSKDYIGNMMAYAYFIPADVMESDGEGNLLVSNYQRFDDNDYTAANQASYGTPVYDAGMHYPGKPAGEATHMVENHASILLGDELSSQSLLTVTHGNGSRNSNDPRPRTVALDESSDTFAYTMHLENGSGDTPYKNVVLINRLPAIGDKMTLSSSSRGSTVGARLASKDLRVYIRPSGGVQSVDPMLSESSYRVEYSSVVNAAYTWADWTPGSGSVTWYDDLPLEQIAAFRVTLEEELPGGYSLDVGFDAHLDVGDIRSLVYDGTLHVVSYDSFSYAITAEYNRADRSVRAEPFQVGVSIDLEQEVPDPGNITLVKKDEQTGKNLPGAVFQLFYKDGDSFREYAPEDGKGSIRTTDSNGEIRYEGVEMGTYRLKEVTAANGYSSGSLNVTGGNYYDKQNDSFSFDLVKDIDLEFTVTNARITTGITVGKHSRGTTAGLSGAEFSLLDENRGILKEGLVTGNDGTLQVTGLTMGVYYLQETRAPANHFLPEGEAAFTGFELRPNSANDDLELYQNGKPVGKLELSIENDPIPGAVTLVKQDQDSGQPLPGAVFELEVLSNESWQSYTPADGGPARRTTGPDGRVAYEQVPAGTYRLVEITPPVNYEAGSLVITGSTYSPTTNSFTVNKNTGLILTASNRRLTGAVELRKYSKGTTTGLEGAVFSLRDHNGKLLEEGLTTGTGGRLVLPALTAGTYSLTETQAPDNYLLPTGEDAVTRFTLRPNTESTALVLYVGEESQSALAITVENTKKPDDPKKPNPGTNEPDTDKEKPGTTRPPRVRFPNQTISIADEDVPLINMLIDILDEQVPLGFFNPGTGTTGTLLLLLCSLFTIGSGLMLGRRGKRKEPDLPDA